jgi:primosomal protein N' (replication factor Y)
MPGYVSVAFDLPVDREFSYREPEGLEAPVGSRVEAAFGRRLLVGWVVSRDAACDLDPALVKPYRRIVDAEPLFGSDTLELARWLAGMYFCSLGEALASMMPSGRREAKPEAGGFDEVRVEPTPVTASAEQKAALARIVSGRGGRYYLYGPTGSGKTEVFLQAAEAALAEGRGVIYLVPEIALTHQVVDAVKRRFGQRCAVLHSGLTPSRRLAEWRRLQTGEADIAVGARSAVFAPVRNLGLVVLDEEHEGSYKSGSSPRYHARQAAMRRAALAGARLVMGSATPSVEAWRLMNESGLERLSLSKRLAGGELPEIEVVDMRPESGALSARLVDEIRRVRGEGGQSILFLNRRGFSYFWTCRACGAEATCKHCSVGLTYHKERGRMVCHYCGYSAEPPGACPSCGSLDTGWAGFGTERVEEDAARLFPELKIARLDADAASKAGGVERILADFRDRKADLLLGTQMVAKGLNFPGVRLVGVVSADTALNMPDFRAAERAFALITQVAGRAGRFEKGGRVVVQTYRPQSAVIRRAAAHDVDGFYREELAIRRELGFPPFARLIRVVLRSKEREAARRAAGELAAAATESAGGAVEVLGPAECPIGMIAGNARYQLILRSAEPGPARSALAGAMAATKLPSGVYAEIDPDPVSLL